MSAIIKPLTKEQLATQVQWLEAEVARLQDLFDKWHTIAAEKEDEAERLRVEFSRFMTICGEGSISSKGRAIDLIPKSDWERARRALEERK